MDVSFEAGVKCFHRCVICDDHDSPHGQNQSMPGQGILQYFQDKLGSTVGVKNTPCEITAPDHRAGDSVNKKRSRNPVSHGISDNAVREHLFPLMDTGFLSSFFL